jgi:hypothetical protein
MGRHTVGVDGVVAVGRGALEVREGKRQEEKGGGDDDGRTFSLPYLFRVAV